MSYVASVRYVDIREYLSPDEYDTFCQMVTNDFSWGDTDLVLVSNGRLNAVLCKRAYRGIPEREAVADKLVACINSHDDTVMYSI
jgi:hypothetical protein